MYKKLILTVLISFLVIFNSCLGLSMDIQMNKDGSGRVEMEYRISHMLENLGAFDGNESMPPIPLSKEDWKKTVERSPGLKLVSHSSKNDKQDTVINIVLDFKNEEALLSFLDPIGEKVSLKRKDNSGTLEIIIIDSPLSLDEDDMGLTQLLLDGYNFSFSFRALGNSVLVITDGSGNSIQTPPSSASVLAGRKVSFKTEMSDIFNFDKGLGLRVIW